MAFGDYTVGTVYSLELDANYDTGLLDAYINGSLALSGFQFATGGSNISTSEVFIHLNGESEFANSVTLGNLTASVPDSGATVAMLGVSFLALAAIRRRLIA